MLDCQILSSLLLQQAAGGCCRLQPWCYRLLQAAAAAILGTMGAGKRGEARAQCAVIYVFLLFPKQRLRRIRRPSLALRIGDCSPRIGSTAVVSSCVPLLLLKCFRHCARFLSSNCSQADRQTVRQTDTHIRTSQVMESPTPR